MQRDVRAIRREQQRRANRNYSDLEGRHTNAVQTVNKAERRRISAEATKALRDAAGVDIYPSAAGRHPLAFAQQRMF